jgi:putative membrane protein
LIIVGTAVGRSGFGFLINGRRLEMKPALLLTTAAVAALSLAACNRHKAGNTADTGNVGANTVSEVNPGQSTPVNKAQDALGAAVGATSAATVGSHDTGAFVDNLVQGNTYEIQAAKIAGQRAKSPDVKAFAHMMVIDHTALGNEAKPVIAKSGKTAPADLDQRRKGLLDNLKAAGAGDFDKTYIDQQVAAHQETLSLLQGYAQNGDDAGLKALADKAAPKVQAHLDRGQAIQSKLGASASAGNAAGR